MKLEKEKEEPKGKEKAKDRKVWGIICTFFAVQSKSSIS